MTKHQADLTVDDYLADGLKDLWYAVAPSRFVKSSPVSLHRFGQKLALWRDPDNGQVHCVEDRCPHRGAPLSMGMILGDRISCPYHGVEVRCDGTVTRVPGSPGCKLEGSRAARGFPVLERNGVIFIYNGTTPNGEPPALDLPEELTSDEWTSFVTYCEWGADYRYVLDNVMDPMHGVFLHKMSHTMFEGATTADFGIRELEHGYIFEKKDQKNVNFDWTEFADTGVHWMRLEIPYPPTGGPGGNFTIIGMCTPLSPNTSSVFFWRCRKLSGWQRDTYRFLYKNRLEQRHWDVLEQDRIALEAMEANANSRENLYSHDMGLVRLRRILKNKALEQMQAQGISTK